MLVKFPNQEKKMKNENEKQKKRRSPIKSRLKSSSPRAFLKKKRTKRNVSNVPKTKKSRITPLTYNSGVSGRNPSPGPVSKEKKEKEC